MSSKFFKDHPPSAELFRARTSQAAWSESFLPVYEWNGLLYVGSSHPEQASKNFAEWPTHWVLLQADEADLKATWAAWHAKPASGAFSADELFSSMGVDVAATEPSPESEGEAPAEEEQLLEGLLAEAPPPPIETVTQTGTFTLPAIPSDDTTPPVSLEKIHSTPAIPGPPPAKKKARISNLPPPTATAAATPDTKPDTKTTAKPALPKVSGGPTPAPEYASAIKEVREVISPIYHSVLLATKAGNSLHIVSWTDTVQLPEHVDFDFSLGTPSPFRIATRTEKPYHGYVIDSAYLTQFFKNWNTQQIPETLTVIPLFKQNALTGYLVAMGSSEGRDRETLQSAERAAKLAIEKWPQSQAKAS